MSDQQPTLVDFNVYDPQVYGWFGTNVPGVVVACYAEPYEGRTDPVLVATLEGPWYPRGFGDDGWYSALELPRKLRRLIINEGGVL